MRGCGRVSLQQPWWRDCDCRQGDTNNAHHSSAAASCVLPISLLFSSIVILYLRFGAQALQDNFVAELSTHYQNYILFTGGPQVSGMRSGQSGERVGSLGIQKRQVPRLVACTLEPLGDPPSPSAETHAPRGPPASGPAGRP